jgi:hypothetical protein
MDGALEQRATQDANRGGESGREFFTLANGLFFVSSLMMIQNCTKNVNTFLEENVLIAPGPPLWLPERWSLGEQDRSIQQAKPCTPL